MNKKQKIGICIGVIITFIFMSYGIIYGHVDYNWEQDKCSNMKTSTYEFTHDVQISADYSTSCYWYQNHPMAYIANLIGCALLGILVSLIPWAIILVLNGTVFDEW